MHNQNFANKIMKRTLLLKAITKLETTLLLALCLPLLAFGQSNYKLGDYNKITKNNIEFQFKNPLPPFEQSDESLSLGGNDNLVISFFASKTMAALQIYSTPIPLKFQQEVDEFFNSEQALKSFVNQIFPQPVNEILEYKVVLFDNKKFIQLQLIGANVQKQVNWITFYKNNMINILGTTLIEDFDDNLPFIVNFKNSINIK
jgi:hypothetical protein